MTIKATDGKQQPAIIMDKLHVDSMTFSQPRQTNPKRAMVVSGVLYGFDENNEKVFDRVGFAVRDDDIDTTIIKAALASGQTIEEFGLEYVTAKATIDAKIKSEQISDAELMAYFEMILARFVELHGKITVSGVE